MWLWVFPYLHGYHFMTNSQSMSLAQCVCISIISQMKLLYDVKDEDDEKFAQIM